MAFDPRPSCPEIDLLCAVVRPSPDLAQAVALLRGPLDFSDLLDLAEAHSVRPRLIQAFAALGWQGVPPTVKAALEGFRGRHVLRALYLAEEHGRIADALLAAGVGFAFFKGAALAVDLYGDLSHREYGDIDLIVWPHQLVAAETVLEDLGYLTRQGDRAFRRAFLAYQRQYTFIRADIGAAVDLHWDFSAGPLPFPLRPAETWRGLRPVRVGSRTMPTVSVENQILLLAGHGTKEAWRSLSWICDFAMQIDRTPGADWAGLYARARRQGCGNSLLLGASMAQALFDSAMPHDLVPLVRRNATVARLTRRLVARLRGGLATMPGHRDLMDLDLCDRRWDRLKAAVRFGLTPTPGDYHALPLPAGLWSAYYFLRPFRLAAKVVTGRRPRREGPAAVLHAQSALRHQVS